MSPDTPLVAEPADRRPGVMLAVANVIAAALLVFWVAGVEWALAAAVAAAALFLLPRVFGGTSPARRPVAVARRPRALRLDRPNALVLFFCNILMLVVLGILAFGMEFALGAALIAAPIWLAAITFLVARASDKDAAL